MISTTFKLHSFMPGHTIEGIIKKENQHAVSQEELAALLDAFHALNGNHVPRVGHTVKIPILTKYADMI